MRIVLLGHSHTGAGVLDAINQAPEAELVFAAGYDKPEAPVPAPDLFAQWRSKDVPHLAVRDRPLYHLYPAGEILISAGWRHLIPRDYYRLFPLAVNLHGSNTRQGYRGRRPIQRQLADGVRHLFLTLHRLTPQVDEGEVLAQALARLEAVPTELDAYLYMRQMAFELTEWLLLNWRALC